MVLAHMTPMLKQFMAFKSEYPDAILFFRMGDFYEMFFDDAVKASRILGITLTSRGVYNGEKIPMCGVPHHAFKAYLAKLIASGNKVAICEQVEDPKLAQGIVKRDVIRLVTPGSVVDEGNIEDNKNIFLAAVCSVKGIFGIAHVDLSTGEFRVSEIDNIDDLLGELSRIDPAELLVPEGDIILNENSLLEKYRIEVLTAEDFSYSEAPLLLKANLKVSSLDGFGLSGHHASVLAAGAVIYYVCKTQKCSPGHINNLLFYSLHDYMTLDETTCSHLELLKTMRRQSEKGSLFHVLDKTMTPMGGRLLKRWIIYPLLHVNEIKHRLTAVDFLKTSVFIREELRAKLKDVYDLERLNGRISMRRANARDLIAFKSSLLELPRIRELITNSPSRLLQEIADKVDTMEDLAEQIENVIHEDPPVSIKEGGIIKEGYNSELDELIKISRDGKGWIKKFALEEQERTGINSLKVGFNKVFGYYIEVTKANLHLVPQDYIRKQTIANGERFITDSLKIAEERVLGAEEKRISLEFEIFERIRSELAAESERISSTADMVATVDVLASLAEVAEKNNYVRPEINNSDEIDIAEGRHPVVEANIRDEVFIPNDIKLNCSEQQLLIITGPNMAGKSTILRQLALTVLMAQMGSFVPAASAVVGVVDRIFTRVGASDDLARGQSTFMVEMTETANILRHASVNSLVILDEIGRGTSTYDGLSIAWAVAESLHDKDGKGVRSLFATHYHELTELSQDKVRVKNFHVSVREWNNRIIFVRKLVAGATSRSYGIQVALIAGLPEEVVARAGELLKKLEAKAFRQNGDYFLSGRKEKFLKNKDQLSLFNSCGNNAEPLLNRLRNLDIHSITPLDALNELNILKNMSEKLE